jgi:hypothetical protein
MKYLNYGKEYSHPTIHNKQSPQHKPTGPSIAYMFVESHDMVEICKNWKTLRLVLSN